MEGTYSLHHPVGPIQRLPFEQSKKQTEEYESTHGHSATSTDKASINLVRISDESGSEEYGPYAVISKNQETSHSLSSLSQIQDPDSNIDRSLQDITPHSDENGFKSMGKIAEIDDIVEVYLRQTKRGRRSRPVTKRGRVTETKPCDPTRVKTDTCPGKFRKVFENY